MVSGKNLRRIGIPIMGACLIVCGFFAAWRKPAAPSVVRVGVDHSPPYYSIEKDGSVHGLGVDVLNEAARRRGIKLIWTPLRDVPLDEALEKRTAQIWPLLTGTPERRRKFYFSEPWLDSNYVVVSLEDHPIRNPNDAAGKSVAHAHLKLAEVVTDRLFSHSRRIVRRTREDAIAAVCNQEAVAAMLEESNVVNALLLRRPPGCEGKLFHVSRLTNTTIRLSIAAVPEVESTAVALRAEIDNLIADGFLSAKLDEWSPFSAEQTKSTWAEKAAEQSSRVYRFYLFVILVFGAVLALLSWRARRLRLAAARAESGLREVQRRFSAFMDNTPVLAFMKDPDGRLLYVNQAWSQTFGISPDDAYELGAEILWSPAIAARVRANDAAALEGNGPRQVIETVPAASGALRDWLVVKFPFTNEKGEAVIGGTAIDVTERERAIRELAASEARYRELFEQNPLPAWVYDRDTLAFLTVNEAAIDHYGWTREDFLSGMRLPDVIAGNPTRHQTKAGLLLSVETRTYDMEYERRPARLTIIRDLTEQERTIEQLKASEERWQLALRGAGDVLWDYDLTTGRIFRSSRWHTLLGYESTVGDIREDFVRFLHPDDIEPATSAFDRYLTRKTPAFSVEYRLRHRDGTWRWILDRGQAVWDERGNPVRMAGAQTDITERKMAENALALQAGTDPLTGIANRRVFDPMFAELVRTALRMGAPLSVCVCDLDSFKEVNDTWGHPAGDRVLIAFAGILRESLRGQDLLARMGGDEFVLALPGTSAAESRARAECVREQLQAVSFVSADGASFRVSCSFGVAELRNTHKDGDELIEEADRLLYGAKGSGRNRTATVAA